MPSSAAHSGAHLLSQGPPTPPLLLLASTVRSGGHPIQESQDGRQYGCAREVTQGLFRLLSLKDIVMEDPEAGFWFQRSYYLCSLKHMVTLNGPPFLHLENTVANEMMNMTPLGKVDRLRQVVLTTQLLLRKKTTGTTTQFLRPRAYCCSSAERCKKESSLIL